MRLKGDRMVKNNSNKLKKSLIISGVFAVAIIAIYLAALHTNNTVADKIKGQILYYIEEDKELHLYNTENKENIIIDTQDEEIKSAVILDNNMYAFSTKEGLLYLADDKSGSVVENIKADCLSWDEEGQYIVYSYEEGASFFIGQYNIKEDRSKIILSDKKKIESVCCKGDGKTVFYSVMEEDKSCIYALDIDSSKEKKLLSKKDAVISGLDCKGDNIIFYTRESDPYIVSIYNIDKDTEQKTGFSSEDYNCINPLYVYDKEYIISSDKAGNYGIYVCNGRNMDLVDAVDSSNSQIILDYINN